MPKHHQEQTGVPVCVTADLLDGPNKLLDLIWSQMFPFAAVGMGFRGGIDFGIGGLSRK